MSLKEQLKGGKNLILQILSSFYVIYKAIRSIHPLYFPPGSTQPCLLMLRHSLVSLGSYSPVKPLGFTPPWKRKLFGSEPPAHIPYF